MRQVVQDGRRGQVTVEEVPALAVRPGSALVRTAASVVSAGTERSVLAFAEKSLLAKARERPDLVRQVLDKVRQEGLAQTYRAVVGRLDHPVPLGYSSAGTVLAVGAGAEPLRVGDRVACGGAGYALHAEVVSVPRNLCVPIPGRPDGGEVPFEEAAFATLGAIALQGVRLVVPTLGERVVVIGLGLIGQLAAQLLRAHGCAVLGIDPDPARAALCRALGADEVLVGGDEVPVAAVMEFTRGRGADAVLIAAATDSNRPVEVAGEISRRKGRVVVVGAVRMDVPRRAYYERELSLTVSCSYGPGRYDPAYEEAGADYPVAYVRWTEQRNLEAFLDLVAASRVEVGRLITHRVALDEAPRAYALLGPEAPEPSLGIVLTYADTATAGGAEAPVPPDFAGHPHRLAARAPAEPPAHPVAAPVAGPLGVAAVGAGAFARSVLFPALRRVPGVRLCAVATASGLSASRVARRFGFERPAADLDAMLADPEVQAVLVLTSHRLHAPLAVAALKAGRHVFVEKPLCVDPDQLAELTALYRSLAAGPGAPLLAVGFNRRFSPLAARLRAELGGRGPLVIAYRVSAGRVPAGHWLEAPEEGGRIVGEACHFIDLGVFLTGALPARVFATGPRGAREPSSVVVDFADGSVLSLQYVTSPARRLPKERLEAFGGDRACVLEDWRRLTAFRPGGTRRVGRWFQVKGHAEELGAFVAAARAGGPPPIPFEELVATTAATFGALESFRRRAPVDLPAG